MYSARIDIDVEKDDPDYPALIAANYIFGGGGLKSRLMGRQMGAEHELGRRAGWDSYPRGATLL